MPSTSKKQHDFMNAVANNPAFAKKAGVPQSVGQDFSKADKALKLRSSARTRADRQTINNPKTDHGGRAFFKEGGAMKKGYADGVGKMAKGGKAHSDVKMDKGMMQKAVNKHEGRLHKGAEMTKLAKGGAAKTMKRGGKC